MWPRRPSLFLNSSTLRLQAFFICDAIVSSRAMEGTRGVAPYFPLHLFTENIRGEGYACLVNKWECNGKPAAEGCNCWL